jgi:hypothetical protein
VLLCATSTCVNALNDDTSIPSLKVLVTPKGVNWIVNLASPFLIAELKNISLPDQTINSGIGIVVTLTEMKLLNVKFSEPVVGFVQPNIIKIHIPDLSGNKYTQTFKINIVRWKTDDGFFILNF